MDLYLKEHAAILKAARSIIETELEEYGTVATYDVVSALMKIQGLMKHYPGFLDYRFAQLLSTAAKRGAFPGVELVRGIGFRYPTNQVSFKKTEKSMLQSVKDALAVLTREGYAVTLTRTRAA